MSSIMEELESQCAICISFMIKPVSMPCKHTICLACYLQHVEKISLQCPFCRKRIGTWARNASKTNSLVDQRKWKLLQEAYPMKVQLRMDGIEDEGDEDQKQSRLRKLSQPGEIRQEFEAAVLKLQQQKDVEARKEEEASRALIEALQKQDQIEMEARRKEEELGLIAARNMDQALKKDVKDKRKSMSPNIERKNVKGKAKQAKSPRTASLTLDAFFDSFPKKALATAPLYSSHLYKSISLSQQSSQSCSSLEENSIPCSSASTQQSDLRRDYNISTDSLKDFEVRGQNEIDASFAGPSSPQIQQDCSSSVTGSYNGDASFTSISSNFENEPVNNDSKVSVATLRLLKGKKKKKESFSFNSQTSNHSKNTTLSMKSGIMEEDFISSQSRYVLTPKNTNVKCELDFQTPVSKEHNQSSFGDKIQDTSQTVDELMLDNFATPIYHHTNKVVTESSTLLYAPDGTCEFKDPGCTTDSQAKDKSFPQRNCSPVPNTIMDFISKPQPENTSDKHTQEENDHLLALELSRWYDELDRKNVKVERFQGSPNEYCFRKKRKC